jgi:hypothetical protein
MERTRFVMTVLQKEDVVTETQFMTWKGTLAIGEFEGQGIKEVRLGPKKPLHYKQLEGDLDCAACGRVIWRQRMVWTDREVFHGSHEFRCTIWGSGL